MVLESLISSGKEVKKFKAFVVGFFFSSVAVILSLWIFRDFASLTIVFLTVLACLPFIYSTIKFQGEKDLVETSEKTILKEHGKALTTFLFLFFGVVVSFSLWYTFLPSSVTHILFKSQTDTIVNINNRLTANAIQQARIFSLIFFNNLKVLIFCILFSFLYGTGAIFILTWNASVIGTAIGNFIRSNLSSAVASSGLAKLGSYFHIFSLGLLKYSIHGVPEILSYFVAGLAGGIISVAVINQSIHSNKFSRIVIDSSSLILISLVLLLLSALLEVFITPLFF
jgi:uncharacterized membrane protein SpoIIM required for sporulation